MGVVRVPKLIGATADGKPTVEWVPKDDILAGLEFIARSGHEPETIGIAAIHPKQRRALTRRVRRPR
jgi:hypothetical protein